MGNVVDHDVVKETKTKIDSGRKQNDVENKRDNDVFKQRRMVFYKFRSTERVEKSPAKVVYWIVFNTYGHGIFLFQQVNVSISCTSKVEALPEQYILSSFIMQRRSLHEGQGKRLYDTPGSINTA